MNKPSGTRGTGTGVFASNARTRPETSSTLPAAEETLNSPGRDPTAMDDSPLTFAYVESLARAGQLNKARVSFEKMLTYANHLGLYSEEIALTGEQIGNFPQAFTHLALINAAITLDRQLDLSTKAAPARQPSNPAQQGAAPAEEAEPAVSLADSG
jgi:hypothetical protein